MKLRSMALGLVVMTLLPLVGCAYMTNRGNDLADIIDAGATTSSKPKFTLYANFLQLLSLGYSNFDGRYYGLSEGQGGAFNARQHAVGLLVWGREQFDYTKLAPKDHPWREPWNIGIVGLPFGPYPPPPQVVNCPKMLHLGWVGLTVNCKFGQLADFILGWTTLDIMGDDTGSRAKDKPAPAPAPADPAAAEKTSFLLPAFRR